MKIKNIVLLIIAGLLMFCGCTNTEESTEDTVISENENSQESESVIETASKDWEFDLELIDMNKWSFDSNSDVYYQTDIAYCSNPLDENYETLGIFVPGAYMNGTKNSDGSYTCEVNYSGTVNGYTAESAPIVFLVNTPGHKAQDAPDGFVKGCTSYTSEGFIYVVAGCRGKDAGVPAGVTDLKAAIRYVRYNAGVIPGNMDRIAVFGHSGGGSQCATLGASGDSELYYPYLASLGAATTSDKVNAVMSWCPITSFDTADLGYEWNMGVTRSALSSEMQMISDSLASAFAQYVDEMNFTDKDGNVLTLEESDEGIYQSGSYYEYVKDVIEESLQNYLADENMSTSQISSYISSLNSNGEWVSYDDGEVTIDSIASFVTRYKKASKPVAAFDKLDEGGHELFNTGDGSLTHFDEYLYEIVKGTSYQQVMEEDLNSTDYLGNSISYRVKMFSPLYYLMENNEGYQSSSVAEYWRIRSGIEQSDTALTTEINLALALEMYGVDVDFETVWDQGHTQAERTGKGSDNFIEWIEEIWNQ
ncbi:MAG: carboxylesterase family protein [Erysipelotrichaceae bacterium]|nr:carboxylesterase family protein [Erysipelotrichaceae bacterium]